MTASEMISVLREMQNEVYGGHTGKYGIAMDLAVGILMKERRKELADGCQGCVFYRVEEWKMPCKECKRSKKDYWRGE